jgi:hypothetical protein
MSMDATKGKSDAAIMKQIIKDATKGLKGEEKEKAIRDLFVKVMPKPKGASGKAVRNPAKKMTAAMGGMAKKKTKYMAMGGMAKKKTKYMAKGGATKKTKYMAKGGAVKKTKYMAKGGAVKKTKYMAKGGATRR